MNTYMIRQGQFVKIGKSKDPQARLRQLQTASPEPLTMLLDWPGDHESYLHSKFQHLRVRGEWFRWDREIEAFLDPDSLVNEHKLWTTVPVEVW